MSKIKYWRRAINKIIAKDFGKMEIFEVIVDREGKWILEKRTGWKRSWCHKRCRCKIEWEKED